MTIAEQGLRLQARLAGALYLLIIVLAGFAEGYVRSSLVVPGQAASTASNILASPGLFRLGVVADLTAFLADAAVAVLLYGLLRATSPTIACLHWYSAWWHTRLSPPSTSSIPSRPCWSWRGRAR